MSHLLMFYRPHCKHCDTMLPLVNRLLQEEGVEVEVKDITEHDANYRLLESYDNDHCNGVPFFMNTKTKEWLCGAVPYDKFLEWAKDE